jgi:hypothetical protein
MSMFNKLGLAKTAEGNIVPGENWSVFSSAFSRRDSDVATLGHVAGTMIKENLSGNVDRHQAVELLQAFALEAEPPVKEGLDTFNIAGMHVLNAKQDIKEVVA